MQIQKIIDKTVISKKNKDAISITSREKRVRESR